VSGKLTPVRLFALLAVAIGIAAVAALVLLRGKDDGASVSKLTSFHFAATVNVLQDAEQELGPPPADRVEGWYQDPDRWRWEFSYADPELRNLGAVLVSDGDALWSYDGATNTYFTRDLPSELRRNPAIFPSLSILLGPLPEASLAGFFDRWQGASWKVVGHDNLLGRPVDVVELRFQEGGVTSFWIDTQYLFVLRYKLDVGAEVGFSIESDITEVQYNGAVDGARFTFTPPQGAVQIEAPDPSDPTAAAGSQTQELPVKGGIAVPDGFFTPGYIPPGLAILRSGFSNDSGGRTTGVELILGLPGPPPDPVLIIDQQFRAGGLDQSLQAGEQLALGDIPAYLLTSDSNARLAWAIGDITVVLTTDRLPVDELLQVARSMQ
jgi:outer membrane lipoprotein-sorting protein